MYFLFLYSFICEVFLCMAACGEVMELCLKYAPPFVTPSYGALFKICSITCNSKLWSIVQNMLYDILLYVTYL